MRYFQLHEFDSPDHLGSGSNMSPTFLSMLDEARATAGIPFKINSGYRTVYYNATLSNSKPDSAHLKGLAADISCTDSRSRFIIINALISVGFTRIGIAKTFIHVDCDTSKDQKVYWIY